MIRKITSMLLVVCMLVSMIPSTAFAAETTDYENATAATREEKDTPVFDNQTDNVKSEYIFTEKCYFNPFDWNEQGTGSTLKSTPKAIAAANSAASSTYNAAAGFGGALSNLQKQVYDALVNKYVDEWGLSNGVTDDITITVEYKSPNDVFAAASSTDELSLDLFYAYWSFVYDYPSVFWVGAVSISYSYTARTSNGTTRYFLDQAVFSIEEKYSGAKTEILTYNDNLSIAANDISVSVLNSGGGSAYDFYKAIHDWMCENVSYNDNAIKNPSQYKKAYSSGGIFAGDSCVTCQGYGEAFKAICDYLRKSNLGFGTRDLYAVEVVGSAYNGNSHMWNYVYMPDGNWYGMDSLWDDQNARKDTYFLCGSASKGFHSTFAAEHIERNYLSSNTAVRISYPQISPTAYANRSCTVSFNLNYGSNSNYKSYTVNRFGYIPNPGVPKRDGYEFAGWYAGKKTSGEPTYSFNNVKIENSVIYYAKWIPKSMLDVFSFTNSYDDFCKPGSDGEGYHYEMKRADYARLIEGTNPVTRLKIKNERNKQWAGSCFGMAAVVALKASNDIQMIDAKRMQVVSGGRLSELTLSLNKDGDNDVSDLESCINYYYLTQFYFSNKLYELTNSNEQINILKIIDKLAAGTNPMLCRIKLPGNGYHEVVCYGLTCEESNGEVIYTWRVYDCNMGNREYFVKVKTNKDGDITELIDENYYSAEEPSFYSIYGVENVDKLTWLTALTTDQFSSWINKINVPASTRAMTKSADTLSDTSSDVLTCLSVNYDSFTISDGSNEATVKDGEIVSDSLGVELLESQSSELRGIDLVYAVPAISDSDGFYLIQPETSDAEKETSIYCDDADGFFSSVLSEGNGTIAIYGNGKVNTMFDKSVNQTISLAKNDMVSSWNNLSLDMCDDSCTIAIDNEMCSIYSAHDTTCQITIASGINTFEFSDVELNQTGITVLDENETTVIKNNDVNIQSGRLGYSVCFDCIGGSSVDSYTGLQAGDKIDKPQNPSLNGYLFDGWYVDEECTVEWDFENDAISGDLILYASWIEDPAYYHQVKFIGDDITAEIIRVTDGTVLTQDDIPDVPEVEGYTCAWNPEELEKVFEPITKDITIHLIYTSNGEAEDIVASGICGDGIKWVVYGNGELNISGFGEIYDYTHFDSTEWYSYAESISSIVVSEGVTAIGNNAFANMKNVASVTIPTTVSRMGTNIFEGCIGLKEITMPFIGQDRDATDENAVLGYHFGKVSSGGVLQYCRSEGTSLSGYYYGIPESLKKVTISDATKISFGAFHNCDFITEIRLNEGVETVSAYSFSGCTGLKEIIIPKSVSTIEEYALDKCTSLESITIPFVGSNASSTDTEDAVFGIIFGRSAEGISQYYYSDGSSFNGYTYAIPATLRKVRITNDTNIPLGAFSNCSMISDIYFNNKVESVGQFAFYNCAINDVYFFGNEEEWNSIDISLSYNTSLTSANRHYIPADQEECTFGNHTFTKKDQVEPDCGNAGHITYICLICSEEHTDIVKATGNHVWDKGQITTEPTIDHEGEITYTCTVCNQTRTEIIPIPESAIAINEQPSDYIGLSGDMAIFTVKATGNDLRYQWYYSSNEGETWAKASATGNRTETVTVEFKTYRAGFMYRCEISDSEGNTVTTNAAKLVLENIDLIITRQPESYAGAVLDEPAFIVEAEGNGLIYQWYVSKDAGETWARSYVPGYNTNVLNPILRTYRDGYQYYCEITDAWGNTVNSDAAIMSVEAGNITIVKQPEDVTGAYQELYQFSVEAEGVNLTYQWYVSKDAGETWAKSELEGHNTNTMNVRMYPYRDGYMYRCEITSGLKLSATTREATLRLKESTVTLISSPNDVNCVIDSTVDFHVEATGENLKYQWYVSQDNGATWKRTELEGCKTDTLTVKALKYRSGYKYRCIITDESGKSVVSNAATLIANNPTVHITGQPQDVDAKLNEDAKFIVEVTGEGLIYQWYVSQDGGETWKKTGLAGNTTNTLTVTAYSYRAGNMYRCEIVDNSGTKEVSNTATLRVTE